MDSGERNLRHGWHHRLRAAVAGRHRLRRDSEGRRRTDRRQDVWHGRVGESCVGPVCSRVRHRDEGNGGLATSPERVNKDAHGSWMVKLTLKNPSELDRLLSAADYEKFVAEEAGH